MTAFDPITGYNPENEVRSITVEIDAPASVVWEILTDLPRYGEWNPFCIKAESTLEIGAPIVMHLTNPWNRDIAINTEYVCANDPEHMLSWKLDWQAEWPYAARRDQIVTALGPQRCAAPAPSAGGGASLSSPSVVISVLPSAPTA